MTAFRIGHCLVIAALFFAPSVAKAVEPGPAFEALVATCSNATIQNKPSTFEDPPGMWHRRRFTIEGMKYDVKKTDSLLHPIVGSVSFTLAAWHTSPVGSKKEAENSSDFESGPPLTYAVIINYSFRNGKWMFTDAAEFNSIINKWATMTKKEILGDPRVSVYAAITLWLR